MTKRFCSRATSVWLFCNLSKEGNGCRIYYRYMLAPYNRFIATARRSRDLWYGSWLLSELSKAAAHKIAELDQAGLAALIFPAPEKIDDLEPYSSLNVANKIVTEISGDPRDIAEEARTAGSHAHY